MRRSLEGKIDGAIITGRENKVFRINPSGSLPRGRFPIVYHDYKFSWVSWEKIKEPRKIEWWDGKKRKRNRLYCPSTESFEHS